MSSLRAVAALALLAVGLPRAAEARRRARGAAAPATVLLDGALTEVRWTDGDTFRILSGPSRGRSARLEGYNALEGYGPVHRWGGWSGGELLELARAASRLAPSQRWECASRRDVDRYGRLLVSCPRAAAELVRRGLAMVYAVGGPADPQLLALQRAAQDRGAGMWAKGVPRAVVTSVHSAAERGGWAYDRLADTSSGRTEERPHRHLYATCQLVCAGAGADRSCMRYVPFERRYRGRPWCLRDRRAR